MQVTDALSIMRVVPPAGIEPALLSELDFEWGETSVSF